MKLPWWGSPGLAMRGFALLITFLAGGILLGVAASGAKTIDRDPNDFQSLIRVAQAERQKAEVETKKLRQEREAISAKVAPADQRKANSAEAAVKGKALQVELFDAPTPATGLPPGADPDSYVVHDQDVQATINAMWRGGAKAIGVQGVRVGANTVIKCVGNVIIIDGQVYSPPYRIVGIGDQGKIQQALDEDSQMKIYQQYVSRYGLGYKVTRLNDVILPKLTTLTSIKARQVGGNQ